MVRVLLFNLLVMMKLLMFMVYNEFEVGGFISGVKLILSVIGG